MAQIGYWILDGDDLYETYGVFVQRGGYVDLLKAPKRKDSLKNNWREENGEEIDLELPRFEARDVNVPFVLVSDKETFWAKHNAFFSKLKEAGERDFRIASFLKAFALYYKDTTNYRLIRGSDKMLAVFTVRFGMNEEGQPYVPNLTQLNAPVQSAPTVDSSSAITVNYTDPNSDPQESLVHIQYDTVNTFDNNPQTASAPINSTSRLITGLQFNTEYFFRVRAKGNSLTTEDSAWSNVQSATTDAEGLIQLNAPTQTAPQVLSHTQIRVFVNDPNNDPQETGVDIEWDTVPTFDNATQVNVGANTINYAVTLPEPDTLYYFRARHRGDGVTTSNSEWSNVQSATTNASPPIILNAPAQSAPTVDSSSAITVNYTDANSSPNEESVEIMYDTVNTFNNDPQTVSAAANSISHQVTGLLADTEYFFRVRAIGNGSTTLSSGWSSVQSATTGEEDSHPLSNALAFWKLDEESGDAVDSVGSNNLTPTGGVSQDQDGIIDRSVAFNGTNAGLIGGSFDLPVPFSFSAWVNHSGAGSWRSVISIGSARQMALHNGNLVFYDGTQRGFSPVPADEWAHIAITYDGFEMKGYINATLSATIPLSIGNTSGPVKLGCYETSNQDVFSGRIDLAGIWPMDIGLEGVAMLYNGGAGSQPPEYIPPPFDAQIDTFGSLSSDQNKWFGGVKAPNGKIYGIPLNSTSVLAIDPSDNSINTFGSLSGTFKWGGGVLAPNGKIYAVPFNSTSILVIDPSDDSTYTFGSLSGNGKWAGGVLAPNGKIYCMPTDHTQILVIDPSDDSTYLIGSFASGGSKWGGGVLAPNGKIYCIPTHASEVLVIDPSDDSTYTFGSFGSTQYKWGGGVLAMNDKIYFMPYSGTQVLEIDPADDSTDLIGNFSGSFKWQGCSLSPNGKIYTVSADGATILEYDPATAASEIINTQSGSLKWSGAILGHNGHIYGIPRYATTVLEIISSPTAQAGADNEIPANLANLATSNYNRFFNNF